MGLDEYWSGQTGPVILILISVHYLFDLALKKIGQTILLSTEHKILQYNWLLVGSVIIDTELGKEDHGLIPAIAIGRELEQLDVRTDPRTKLN
jgi:hypothetical protein